MDTHRVSTPLKAERRQLEWAAQLFTEQPHSLRQEYLRAGGKVAEAVSQLTYQFSLTLPHLIFLDGAMRAVPADWSQITVGNILSRMQRKPKQTEIIHRLSAMAQHADAGAQACAHLVLYHAASTLLTHVIPPIADIEHDCVAFDMKGRLLISEADAPERIAQLSLFMSWLRLVQQIYPSWAADDEYNERLAHLTALVTQQGRALAKLHTDQLIQEVTTLWKSGGLAMGLTLFVPYLDEHTYQMARHPVVVIPHGRIPFRPEFVVSACRVAGREVRNRPGFTQSTRWQLISRLDQIAQAFTTPASATH